MMALRSLLVPIDLSPLTDRVLARLALLPLAPRARVTLGHTVPSSLAIGAQRRAIRDAKDALAQERAQLLATLPAGVTVRTVVNAGVAATEIAAAAEEADAELVVMGRGSPQGLRDAFLGSTAERVIRKARVPVLAVRTAVRGAYRRPVVALDRDAGAADVVTVLLRILTPPRPAVTVVHAFDVPLREMRYPNLADEDLAEVRAHYRQEALGEVTALVRKTVPGDEISRWRIQAKFGNPRALLPKAVRHEHADLLAMATRGLSGAAHAFLGTVAGDLLRHVACDALVVPPTHG
jgi:nucleotide-binding universal stress UspA family protein